MGLFSSGHGLKGLACTPTPVSALIHAATMVTAGVFLITRSSFIYEFTSNTLNYITVIGALTSFFAATIGLVQNDLKRVIAFSTCSQLGYMVFACGLSSYSSGFFHLTNHAFLCAVHVHIFTLNMTTFIVLERLAHIVINIILSIAKQK